MYISYVFVTTLISTTKSQCIATWDIPIDQDIIQVYHSKNIIFLYEDLINISLEAS